MGFGTVAANIIMFIAVITIAGGFVIYFNVQAQEVSSSLNVQQERLKDELKTDITITSVSFTNATNPHTTTAYVENTGKTKLELAVTDVYIDGLRYDRADRNISIESDTEASNPLIWDPNEVAKIEAYGNLSSTIHTIRVVTDNAQYDEDTFSN